MDHDERTRDDDHDDQQEPRQHRGDPAHDAAVSGGTPNETSAEAGSPGAGTVDDDRSADVVDGVLSPGSSATGSPTEPA